LHTASIFACTEKDHNTVMENSFGHLKEELVHHVRFLSTEALATALNEYIRWYNGEKSAQNPRA
jgi:hypothetical protein